MDWVVPPQSWEILRAVYETALKILVVKNSRNFFTSWGWK